MSAPKTAGGVFSRWISNQISPFLTERGWRRAGLIFVKPVGANTVLIAFRRWKWNTAETCRFFVEAGVFSPRIAEHDADRSGIPVPSRPTLDLGAVSRRLATFMGEREDVFWTVRASSLSLELQALGASVRDKLDAYVLPFVSAHSTDEAIRDDLLARLDDLDPHSLGRLALLVSDLGPRDRLADISAQLGRSEARLAAERAEFVRQWRLADDADAAAADAAMRRLGRQ